LSPAPDGDDTTPGHTGQGPPDTRVIPGTTIGTEQESSQPLQPENEQPDCGSGEFSDLVYPKALLPAERARAEVMIAMLAAPLNQQVLDEWAGIIRRRYTEFIARLSACADQTRAGGHLYTGACLACRPDTRDTAANGGGTSASRAARTRPDRRSQPAGAPHDRDCTTLMQEITGDFMKPPHICTEGLPMQTNAACVTGNSLAHRLLRSKRLRHY
jgi:hypothetical protein